MLFRSEYLFDGKESAALTFFAPKKGDRKEYSGYFPHNHSPDYKIQRNFLVFFKRDLEKQADA